MSDTKRAEEQKIDANQAAEFEVKKVTKKANKKDIAPVETLFEFLQRFLEYKGKPLAQDKKAYEKLSSRLTEEEQGKLVELYIEKDKELKCCFALGEFLLDGSRDSSIRLNTLDFIERVVSNYSLFRSIKSNAVFQAWLEGSKDKADKLEFFEGNFRALTIKCETEADQKFTDTQILTLLCIGAIWLYFKRQSNFFTLIHYLGRAAFDTQGQSLELIEPAAFSFAASMISSNKRKSFGAFLRLVSEEESKLSRLLKLKSKEVSEQALRINKLTTHNGDLADKADSLENEINRLTACLASVESELEVQKEKARHRDTHHADSKDDLRIKLRNVLEGELKDVLEKAQRASDKGKTSIVDYQINDALEILSRELKRVETND